MRDSINYNLKYFIMKMSGTKPMKNTMRKSPLKQTTVKSASASGMEVKPSASKSVSATKVVKATVKKTGAPGAVKKRAKSAKADTPMMQMKKNKY